MSRAPLRWPFPLALALRYLKSTRKDAFVSFLSATAAGGIALGVAALILALAALTGFQELLRGEILARTPQIQVTVEDPDDAEELAAAILALDGVHGVRTLVHGRGWLIAGAAIRPVEIVGHDGPPPASHFPGVWGRGRGVYLGDSLALAWGFTAGEVVEIASSRPTLSPVGPQPRLRRLEVAGTFEVGRTEQSDRIAIPLDEADRLFGRRSRDLDVSAGGLDEALAVRPAVEALVAERLGDGGRVASWQDLNRPLFFALRLEKGVMFVAVFLIVVVAALALISGVSLLVSKKSPEIGILRAMGATRASLWRAFLTLGALLAICGMVAGGVVGIVAAWLLDRYELLSLPADVYFVDHVPFAVSALDVFTVLASSLALSLACASYAATRAAALSPIEALKR